MKARNWTTLTRERSSSLYLNWEPFCVKTTGLKLVGNEGCDNNGHSIVMGKLQFTPGLVYEFICGRIYLCYVI